MHLELASRAGKLRTRTVGDPGIQGVVTGMQGIGVSTPSAAAVAAITIGLAGDMHMPNVGIFAIGTQSIIFAACGPCPITVGTKTTSGVGAIPCEHFSNEPMFTNFPAIVNTP